MTRTNRWCIQLTLGMTIFASSLLPAGAVGRLDAWQTVRNADGSVRALYGRDSNPLSGETAEARARDFLRQEADTFGLRDDLSDLELLDASRDDLGDHVRFQQTYEGYPVLGSQTDVHLNGDHAYLASSTYRTLRVSQNGPSITQEAGWLKLSSRRNLTAPLSPTSEPQLVLWPASDEAVATWAWRYRFKDGRGLPFEAIADAETGTDLLIIPRYHEANATVYRENPLTTPVREPATLLNLDNTGFLSSPYADVRMNGRIGLRGATGDRLKSTDTGFRFPPGDSKFAHVNAYYHVNQAHDFFKKNGAPANIDQLLPVLLRFRDPLGNAFPNAMYDPQEGKGGSLIIGEGPEGHDFALDADVLIHEYGHYAANVINENFLNSYTLEAGGLNEGFSDYFAATLTGNPCTAEFLSKVVEVGDCLRDLSSRRHYPEDTGTDAVRNGRGYIGFTEIHVIGELAGGAAWDLRNLLGAEITDRLLVGAISLLNGASTLPDFRAAMLGADSKLNGGANAEKITQVFDARGIGTVAATYLAPNSFSSLRQQAEVHLGPILSDGDISFVSPWDISAAFAAGRTYRLSGFIADTGATSVTVKVTDAQGQVVTDMAQQQDVSNRESYSEIYMDPGRSFDLPLRFPEGLAGQTVSLTLTFQKGTRTWSASKKVSVVADQSPSEPITEEPEQPLSRVLGDADGDRKITTADATVALRVAIGLETSDDLVLLLDVMPRHADGTSGDDKITVADVSQILKVATGRLR